LPPPPRKICFPLRRMKFWWCPCTSHVFRPAHWVSHEK
jgi:hypothetical protein